MFEIQYLKVGQKGVINYDIPVYTIGDNSVKGSKTFTIACSIHGDETAGLFIVNDFLNKIKGKKLKGKINIIPAANPVAQFLYSRTSFLDQKDLNRTGKGRSDGSYTERLAHILLEFFKMSDLVINIHEFEMVSPIMGIFDIFGNKDMESKIFETLKVFNPDMIWQINYDRNCEMQYLNTLDLTLSKEGIINFAFETSQLPLLKYKDIDKASDGLLNLCASLGITDTDTKVVDNNIPIYIRKETTSDISGLWIPDEKLEILKPLKKGQLIGKVVSLPNFKEENIYCPENGILLQYRVRQMINIGTSIFSIG